MSLSVRNLGDGRRTFAVCRDGRPVATGLTLAEALGAKLRMEETDAAASRPEPRPVPPRGFGQR